MNALQRFHRDDDAQISFLALAAVICFVALLAMVVNTNDVVEERVRMQNVADAMVLSSAAWSARGLNLVSFVNVLNTKLVTMAVLLNSMKDALPIIIKIGEVQRAVFSACQGVPFVGIVCSIMVGVTSVQLAILRVADKAVRKAANTLATCNSGKLWTLSNGLQAAAKTVRTTFVGLATADSIDIAEANGATFGLVVNGNIVKLTGLTLPVMEGDFKKFFCPRMKNGGSGYKLEGYRCLKDDSDESSPLRLGQDRQELMLMPFINFGAPFIFSGMVSKNMVQIGCDPTPAKERGKSNVMLTDLAECKEYKATAKWSITQSRTVQVTDATWTVKDFIPWKATKQGAGQDTSEAERLKKGLEGLDPGDLIEDAGGPAAPKFTEAYQAIDPATESSREVPMLCIGDPTPAHAGYQWVSNQQVPGQPDGKPGGYFIKVTRSAPIQPPAPPKPPPIFDENGKEIPQPEPKKPPLEYVYTVDTITLTSAGEKEMDAKELDEYYKKKGGGIDTQQTSNSSKCKGIPKPWVLDTRKNGWENSLRFIGVVYKDIEKDPPFWSTFFADPPERLIAYAQAQVYNDLEENLFTQDWRVRLERANLLESFLGEHGATAGVNTGAQKAKNPNVFSSFLNKVNNH